MSRWTLRARRILVPGAIAASSRLRCVRCCRGSIARFGSTTSVRAACMQRRACPSLAWERRSRNPMPRSLFEKVWDAHVVEQLPGDNALVFVDRVVAHEITTPQGALEIERKYADKLFD